MKYITLPVHLLSFWYIEGVTFFVKTWKNLILLLEEDLAVGLMLRLIFTPLFHDASFVGRILSFLFRVIRIIMGLFGFAIATLVLFLIGGYWLVLPILALFDIPTVFSQGFFLAGVGLFLIHVFTHPHKKVWQVGKNNLWDASTVKKSDLSFKKLLTQFEVTDLLSNLEIQLNGFPDFEIKDSQKVAEEAFELAKKSGGQYLTPRHFFVAAVKQIPNIDNFLLKLDLKIEDFEQCLIYLEKKRQEWRKVFIWDDDFTIHHLKGVNRGWLGVPTPTLDLVGEDLTKIAASKGFLDLIREKSVVAEVVNILSQQTGRNVILVGPAGSGKTSLIRFLAKQIVTGDAPAALATKRLMVLDLVKLMSGMKTQGDLAERIKNVFDEVSFAQNIIIVIEEIHELGMGEAGSQLNLYSLLEPYLESDAIQFVGTTEPENYSRILEKNASFARMFRKIELEPASYLDTISVLQSRSIEAERGTKVKVTFLAIKAAAEFAQKLIKDRVLPDSAISVLKEAQTQAVNKWVTKEVIKRVVSSRVKVPLIEIDSTDKEKLLNLEQEIHNRLIGQDYAVKVISDTLRRSATGLRDTNRPIGSFLFVGPTGVGKTELAKTLSEVYFKTSGVFIRFDMSEYQNEESVSRLIGTSTEGGQLTEAVRNKPYALLLLDEFEKANPKILTLFLQVLEDGRLTDGTGKTIDFSHTIIIATSNAASLFIAKGLDEGKTLSQLDKIVNDELLKVFKPELINRFDDVVLFSTLTQEDLQKIVRLKITQLKSQIKEQGFLVEFDEGLISALAQKGFDPILGARPLRRLIQDTLEARLSRMILENKLVKGQLFKATAELLN